LWDDLLDGDVTVGEFQLQEHRTSWVLHVTIEYEVTEPEEPNEPTPVGFDIGESKLLTDNDTPTQLSIYDGSRARHPRKEMHTTLKRLRERDAAEWRVDDYQDALTDIVEKASREAVEYDESFKNPVIVLEGLSYIREHLNYGKWMNRRLHN
jgi:transposase